MSAQEIFNKALLGLRRDSSWLSAFMHFWIEPAQYIPCWFAGENEKMRVWDFQIADEDVDKFLAAVPDAEARPNEGASRVLYGAIYRVRVNKEAEVDCNENVRV